MDFTGEKQDILEENVGVMSLIRIQIQKSHLNQFFKASASLTITDESNVPKMFIQSHSKTQENEI